MMLIKAIIDILNRFELHFSTVSMALKFMVAHDAVYCRIAQLVRAST